MWPRTLGDFANLCGASAPEDLSRIEIAGITVSASAQPDEAYWALREDGQDGHEQVEAALSAGAAAALVAADWPGRSALSPEHQARCLVVNDTLLAMRKAARGMRRDFSFPVVAVGGSHGKTSTKEMIAALLDGPGRRISRTPETMNGHSGIPWTLLQREHHREAPPDALVVEIGIDAPGAMVEHARLVSPDIVVLTALGAEHLAGLGDEKTAVAEELQLFEASPGARRVYHAADAFLREALSSARVGDIVVNAGSHASEAHGFDSLAYQVRGASPDALTVEISWRPAGATEETALSFDLPMPGAHNGANLAVATAVALALGRPPEGLVGALRDFIPPSMRCELSELPGGFWLLDDSYNANPASMEAALALLASPAWKEHPRRAILGDMLDLGESTKTLHSSLAPQLASLARGGVQVALYGEAMAALRDELLTLGIHAEHAASKDDPCVLLDALDLSAGSILLVKGSRGMHLERVVNKLRSRGITATVDDLAAFHGHFRTACVTGTNGKTTTTSLIAAIVQAAGETPCRVTTLGAWVGEEMLTEDTSGNAFLATLQQAAARGVRTLAIETTSLALARGFARSWPPDVAVFTNLSRDHLDYHESPEHYLAAKAQLFMNLPPGGVAILNLADPASALLDEVMPASIQRLGYAVRPPDPGCAAIPVALRADEITVTPEGTRVRLAPSTLGDQLGGALHLHLIGEFHAENALAALLAGSALGYPARTLLAGLASFRGVEGRFEIVNRAPLVVVDYAHTPDALARTLELARTLCPPGGHVACVFGCGGERDPGKRKEMGAAAASGAHLALITNDNPRSEDPETIAEEIEAGAREAGGKTTRILDRKGAIQHAILSASPQDVVVIAGKGHEKTQEMNGHTLAFDDKEIARKAILLREQKGQK